jgi:hypothetical protein
MSLKNMASCIFISKNLDMTLKLKQLLSNDYGATTSDNVSSDVMVPYNEVRQAIDAVGPAADGLVDWDVA